MRRPRIFLSTVSEELRSARQQVAATVRTLGFDPVSQDDFPSGHGELRGWLMQQIDGCEGLIQIVGQGYGAEPPTVDAAYGRVSYTQFEFWYAREKSIKTWIVVAGAGVRRDKPEDQLDLPRDPVHPDPAGYQAERRRLQQAYIERLRQHNHLRHHAANDTELENIILKLRDELGALRQQWELWLRQDAQFKSHTTEQLAAIEAAAKITTEKIRAHLLETIAETHRAELAEAERATDWQQRQRLREAANTAHAAKLEKVDELVASFAEIERPGGVSSVFREMSRILAEQGVNEALAYMRSQRAHVLQAVRARMSATQEINRVELRPLLQAALLYEQKGDHDQARLLFAEILNIEPHWSDALFASAMFHIGLGNLANLRATQADAWREYEQAYQHALSLCDLDPTNLSWQQLKLSIVGLLGNVAFAQGRLVEASRWYEECLSIAKKLAAGNPSNGWFKRDLAVSLENVGDAKRAQGKLDDAAKIYDESLAIHQELVAGDPQNTFWLYGLSIAFHKVGIVSHAQGRLADAEHAYAKDLSISRKVAGLNPQNVKCQRDLAASYGAVGDIALLRNDLGAAVAAHRSSSSILEALLSSDKGNTQLKRDFAVLEIKRGTVALAWGGMCEASAAFQSGLRLYKELTEKDRSNSRWRHELAVCYEKLGDLAAAQTHYEKAILSYTESLNVWRELAEFDVSNIDLQHGIYVSYRKLATSAERIPQLHEATQYWNHAFEVLSNIVRSGAQISSDDHAFLDTLRKKLGKN